MNDENTIPEDELTDTAAEQAEASATDTPGEPEPLDPWAARKPSCCACAPISTTTASAPNAKKASGPFAPTNA